MTSEHTTETTQIATTAGVAAPAPPGGPPHLTITVQDAGVEEFAAVPTLRFRTRIDTAAAVRSLSLTAQIRIAAPRRRYDPATQERLTELFGAPADWGRNLRSLLWTHVTWQVPAFTGSTVVDVPVGCTYDFDVAAVKYFHALPDGEIPLEFLFSGTVFYTHGGALQAAHVPWDTESTFHLPVRLWKDMMAHYFPQTAWLRLRTDTFDRLAAYKARHTLPTWEDAVESLLAAAGGDLAGGHPASGGPAGRPEGGRPWTP